MIPDAPRLIADDPVHAPLPHRPRGPRSRTPPPPRAARPPPWSHPDRRDRREGSTRQTPAGARAARAGPRPSWKTTAPTPTRGYGGYSRLTSPRPARHLACTGYEPVPPPARAPRGVSPSRFKVRPCSASKPAASARRTSDQRGRRPRAISRVVILSSGSGVVGNTARSRPHVDAEQDGTVLEKAGPLAALSAPHDLAPADLDLVAARPREAEGGQWSVRGGDWHQFRHQRPVRSTPAAERCRSSDRSPASPRRLRDPRLPRLTLVGQLALRPVVVDGATAGGPSDQSHPEGAAGDDVDVGVEGLAVTERHGGRRPSRRSAAVGGDVPAWRPRHRASSMAMLVAPSRGLGHEQPPVPSLTALPAPPHLARGPPWSGPGGAPAWSREPPGSRPGSIPGLAGDLDHRVAERVERLLGLGLRGLDHERLFHDEREVGRGGVEAEIE